MANITEFLGRDIRHYKDYVRTSSGDRERIEGLDNYKEACLRRIITTPGSIVHRPTYGVGAKDYLNAPSTLSKQRELAKKIEEQLMQDPRTEKVSGVSISVNQSKPDLTKIIVRVKPVGYDEIEMKFEPFGA
jgi:phage baseplate assembly protein W